MEEVYIDLERQQVGTLSVMPTKRVDINPTYASRMNERRQRVNMKRASSNAKQ